MKKILPLFLFGMLTTFYSLAQSDPCTNFAAAYTFSIGSDGLTVDFDNQSTGSYTALAWDFGDGMTSTTVNPSHTYGTDGTYEVCLVIESNDCRSETCKIFTVETLYNPTCEAFFEWELDGTGGIVFTGPDNIFGLPVDLFWDFGDNTTSTATNPTHFYTDPGTYEVCLGISIPILACEDIYCEEIVIEGDDPCLGFEASFNYDIIDDTVIFIDASTGNPEYWVWNYGDGNSDTYQQSENPDYVYPPGTYTACLVIEKAPNCRDEQCVTFTIEGDPPPTCEVTFVYDFINDNTVVFDANFINDGTFVCSWDFGDGFESVDCNPQHTFDFPGTYEVCINIANDICEDVHCQAIIIDDPNDPCDGLVANFVFETHSDGLTVDFESQSLGNVSTVEWDFGDGTTTSGNSTTTTHTYANAGTYTVCLTVYDNAVSPPCVSDICETIVVIEPIACEAAWDYVIDGDQIIFVSNATPDDGTYTCEWDFGFGLVYTGCIQEFDASILAALGIAPGVYEVCMTYSNGICEDVFCHDVPFEDVDLCAGFEVDFLYGNDPNNTAFHEFLVTTNTAYDDIIWTFGDGATATNDNDPSHTYTQSGVYVVCVFIESNSGCQAEQCYEIEVTVPNDNCTIEANFEFEMDGSSLIFNSTSTPANDGSYVCEWDFGWGLIYTGCEQVFDYADLGVLGIGPGTYEVCLTYSDGDGICSDTNCQAIEIVDPVDPCAGFEVDFAYEIDAVNPLMVNFVATTSAAYDFIVINFGDGNSVQDNFAVHTYAASGTYEVCVVIESYEGCRDEQCYPVTVEASIVCEIEANWEFDLVGNDLTFTNTSTPINDGSYTCFWDFGFGLTETTCNASFDYSYLAALGIAPGTYEVCLTYSDNDGICSDTNCQDITIVDPVDPCLGFEVDFTYGVDINNALLVEFGVITSAAYDFIIFDFGDGNTSQSATPSHTYANSGTYEVCVVIESYEGCRDEQCYELTFEEPEVCEAFWNTLLINGLSVQFNNESFPYNDPNYTCSWSYGDGVGATDCDPLYTYDAPGTYEVCLTYSNGVCEDTYCSNITVLDPCAGFEVDFTYTIDANNPLLVEFEAITSSAYDFIVFNFGDGNSMPNNAPIYTYATGGTYEVCVVIESNEGCRDEQCYPITVEEPVTCNIVASWEFEAIANDLIFTNTSTPTNDGSYTCSWDFGWGLIYTNCIESFDYSYLAALGIGPGTYEVCLTYTNVDGTCSDTHCDNVIIEDPCAGFVVDFSYAIDPVDPLMIEVVATTTASYDFIVIDFGDGNTVQNSTANHTYANGGTYEVCVVIESYEGCRDEQCYPITVEEPATCNIVANWEFEAIANDLIFTNTSTPTNDGSYTCAWDFGWGLIYNNCIESFDYSYLAALGIGPGTYEVCLTYTNVDETCSDTHCDNVTIEDPCAGFVVDFSYGIDPVDPLMIEVAATTTASYDFIVIDFGDGNTVQNSTANHTYANGGTYEVCVVIESYEGCRDEQCYPVTIQGPAACEANWTFTMDGSDLIFENLSTPDDGTYTCQWNFGFGLGFTDCDLQFNYSDLGVLGIGPGTYEACLTWSNDICSDTHCQDITITDPCAELEAAFIFEAHSNGATVDFENQSTGGIITSVEWDFGDGTGNTGMNNLITHTFSAAGIYEVCMTVITDDNCSDVICQNIEIVLPGFTNFRLQNNPITNDLQAEIDVLKAQAIEFILINPSSKVTQNYIANAVLGHNTLHFDVSNMPRGFYIMIVKFEDGSSLVDKVLKVED